MSLAIFENFLKFAEGAVRSKPDLPSTIDPAEFESALVNYGVVLLHSHMEQCIRKAIDVRCARCVDAEVRTFALKARKESTGKLKIEYLKGSLTRFSDGYKDTFDGHLRLSGLGDSWDSVVNHRHTVAHEGQPASLTLADLRIFYDHVRKVLGFFCAGLCLTTGEIQGISNLIVQVPSPPSPAAAGPPTAAGPGAA